MVPVSSTVGTPLHRMNALAQDQVETRARATTGPARVHTLPSRLRTLKLPLARAQGRFTLIDALPAVRIRGPRRIPAEAGIRRLFSGLLSPKIHVGP